MKSPQKGESKGDTGLGQGGVQLGVTFCLGGLSPMEVFLPFPDSGLPHDHCPTLLLFPADRQGESHSSPGPAFRAESRSSHSESDPQWPSGPAPVWCVGALCTYLLCVHTCRCV
jgi:hypothetical protein